MKRNRNKNHWWTEEEDKKLLELLNCYSNKRWSEISIQLHEKFGFPSRSPKQCRQRWNLHLNPDLVKKEWSPEEEQLLLDQHKIHGNKWTLICEVFPGRSDNSIKSHFYSIIRRCLRRMSKVVGLKNSTQKLKNIKPATLSLIFSMAQRNFFSEIKNKAYQEELQKYNFKIIMEKILEFLRWKPKSLDCTEEVKEISEGVLQSIFKINQLFSDNEEYKDIQGEIKRKNMGFQIFNSIDEEIRSQKEQIERTREKSEEYCSMNAEQSNQQSYQMKTYDSIFEEKPESPNSEDDIYDISFEEDELENLLFFNKRGLSSEIFAFTPSNNFSSKNESNKNKTEYSMEVLECDQRLEEIMENINRKQK